MFTISVDVTSILNLQTFEIYVRRGWSIITSFLSLVIYRYGILNHTSNKLRIIIPSHFHLLGGNGSYTDYYHKSRTIKDFLSNELDDVNEEE